MSEQNIKNHDEVSAEDEDAHAAGARQIAPLVLTGGNTIVGGPQGMSSSYVDYLTIYNENPDTVAPWTPGEINAAEFGSETA